MRRSLIVAGVAALIVSVASRDAPACKRFVPEVYPPGVVGGASMTSNRRIPQNGGVIVDVSAGPMDDAALLAKVRVVVTGPSGPIAGTTQRLSKAYDVRGRPCIAWIPANRALLPVGPITVTIEANGKTVVEQVEVEPRSMVVAPRPPIVQWSQVITSLPGAPAVTCQSEGGGSSCRRGPRELSIPLTYVAEPRLNTSLAVDDDNDRFDFARSRVEPFVRDAAGAEVAQPVDKMPEIQTTSPTFSAPITQRGVEYCVRVTTTLLDNEDTKQVAVACIPHDESAFSLPPDQARLTRAELASRCADVNAVKYPPGYSEDDLAEPESGCASAPKGPRDAGIAIGLACLALTALRRKRRDRSPRLACEPDHRGRR